MFDFVNYIYESGISLGLFTLLYFLFLQRETYFRTNRLFLLFALLFSVLLPLVHLRILEAQPVMLSEITVTPYRNLLETVSVYGNEVSTSIVQEISTSTYIIGVYLLGMSFFALRLLIRLVQISRLIRRNKCITEQGMKLVLLDRELTPFSFLSYVFASKNIKDQSGWEKMLIHEFEHVKQGHSFDILVLEVLTVFQWFNPFFWLMKRLLRENHEFLADRAVLAHEASPAFYKKLLLQQFIGPQIQMTNNFNYSLIKKRIQMMSKIKSTKLARVKLIGGLVLAVILVGVFSLENKVEASQAFTAEVGIHEATLLTSPVETDVALTVDEPEAKNIEKKINSTRELVPDSVSKVGIKDIDGVEVVGYGSQKLALNGQLKKDGEDTLTIVIDGEKVELTGSRLAILKMKRVLSDNNQYKLNKVTDSGEWEITSVKNNPREEYDNQTIDGEPVFFIVEEMPEFPGGELALRKAIAQSVKYPQEAQIGGIQGKVYVNFVVDKAGKVRNAKVVRSVHESLDNEARRVVLGLPDWKPGKQRGEAVNVSYTVPINFSLQ